MINDVTLTDAEAGLPQTAEGPVQTITAEPSRLTRLAEKAIESLPVGDQFAIRTYVIERQAAIHAGGSVSDVDNAHPSPSFRWACGAVVATMANERPFLLIASFVCLNANLIAGLVYLIRRYIA